jgi:hypothetical protein
MAEGAQSQEPFVVCCLGLWHFAQVRTIVSKLASPNGVHAEARQLHARVKRIAANKKSALRFLAATGMYTLKGELKPRFR